MSRERYTPRQVWWFLGRLLPRLTPYRGSLAIAGILLLAATAIGLAFPPVARELLDSAFLAGDASQLNLLAIGLLGLFAVQAVINFRQS